MEAQQHAVPQALPMKILGLWLSFFILCWSVSIS
jgi:hypothetical protein